MRKIITTAIVMVLFLGVFLLVGFVFKQDAKITENSTANKEKQDMRNLTIMNDLQKYGIEIIPSASENFNSGLKEYIGSEDSLFSLVESAKPLAFFIKNNSSKEIVGVSLRWKFSDSNGKSFEVPQSEANPGVLMGIKPLDPQMIGKTSLINSKAIKFFTYFNDMVGHKVAFANMRYKNPSVNFRMPDKLTQSDISNLNFQKERTLSSYTDLSVSIDGVVFADGTFAGANKNSLFDVLRGHIQASKDILTALTEAKSSGKRDEDIVDEILSKTSNISVDLFDPRSANATHEQAFDHSYKTYLKNLRDNLVMKRSRMSDDYIVKQFQSVRPSDIVTLRKVDNSSK